MTDYGNSSYGRVIISTAISSGGPSGDKYYLVAEKWQEPEKNQLKKTILAGNAATAPSLGKRDWSLKLSNVYPIPFGTTYTTTELAFNHLKTYLDAKMVSGSTFFYIFILHPSGAYVPLGYYGGAATNYLKVKLLDVTPEGEMAFYRFSTITFTEVTTG